MGFGGRLVNSAAGSLEFRLESSEGLIRASMNCDQAPRRRNGAASLSTWRCDGCAFRMA
jgi:hypothetical protein